MIMAMIRPDTEMKDSGIECIESIPKGWITERIKNLFSERNEKVDDAEPNELLSVSEYYGVAPRSEKINSDTVLVRAESLQGYKRCEKNDIVSNIMLAWKGAMGISQYRGVVSPSYCVYAPQKDICSQYYHYLFRTDAYKGLFKKYSTGIIESRLRLYTEQFFERRAIVPPLSEQQAIADYLDEACSKIDEIIAEAKASIDEYKELKQSILFETMTRGIQSDRKYKTCDYEWLGKVPEDWSLMKIIHILDDNDSYPIGDGDHGLIKTDSYKSEGIPYIRVQNIGWGTPLLMDNVVYISKEDNERIKGSQLKPGDVLFVKTGATIGKTAIVPNNIPISNTTSHVGKITVSKEHNSKYIFYLLSSFIGYKQFWDIACMKATRPELSISEIKQMKVLIPSTRDEEDEIVEYLDNKLPEYETLICIKESLINDLEAYKKSLIYEVVTGKRKVV